MLACLRLPAFGCAVSIALSAFAPAFADVRRTALPGENAIRPDDLRRDVTFLASDANEGRKTAGGFLEGPVTQYLEAEVKRLGLEPGGVNGTYRQPWRYRSWEEPALAPAARRAGLTPHLHRFDMTGEGPVPASEFGSRPNEQGIAYSPDGEPVSVEPIEGVPLLAAAEPNTHNLLAIVRGSDPALAGEWIVLGAHMDHLGKSAWGSGADKICNGADDNGSGTVALLAVARAMAASRGSTSGPRRNVLICWFAGEELGLLGSQYFVGKPTIPLGSIKGMLNVDMVGRLNPDQVSVCDKAPSGMTNVFHELHDAEGLGFKALDHNIESYLSRSDQYPFYKRGIPVMFFFEGLTASGGLNADYHRVSDHADKLDYDKGARIARLMFRHVMGAANHP
jgi:hypothetical protein